MLAYGGSIAMVPEFRTAEFWDAIRDTETAVAARPRAHPEEGIHRAVRGRRPGIPGAFRRGLVHGLQHD
ncbi:hypothetical protein G6F64_015587 [Rhizopus arrhizus]|uniref:Uncharacterized protein n=1 Tax=Rhizopus oryzae TaxID=64495 RepID=A0A9P7BIG5_RHIOR|nr:hypothetical protein G6F64_015587 [Rhizopus arrhizus]